MPSLGLWHPRFALNSWIDCLSTTSPVGGSSNAALLAIAHKLHLDRSALSMAASPPVSRGGFDHHVHGWGVCDKLRLQALEWIFLYQASVQNKVNALGFPNIPSGVSTHQQGDWKGGASDYGVLGANQ